MSKNVAKSTKCGLLGFYVQHYSVRPGSKYCASFIVSLSVSISFSVCLIWMCITHEWKVVELLILNVNKMLLFIAWKDKGQNEDIRNQTKLPRMDLIIKERRLRWLGHVLCMEDDRIPKQAMYWQMESQIRRKSGRPRMNWIDTIARDLKSIGIDWDEAEQAAVNRKDWRERVAQTAQCVFDTG